MTLFKTPQLPTPERSEIELGFLPLIDCAPLVIAKEKGFFAESGLAVSLSKEGSWASIRDKVVLGLLDGAQMLAGIPLASTLGLSSPKVPMVTAFNIGLNGKAITLSNTLLKELNQLTPASESNQSTAAGLKKIIQQRRQNGEAKLTLAMVYPYSTHNYLLRYWLSDSDIDPDKDVNLIVVPPQQMAQSMKKGMIDGYCVGEPWNSVAQIEGIGSPVISGYEIWNNCPDKVFAVKQTWAKNFPATHKAIICALIMASDWLDQPQHYHEAIEILNQPEYLDNTLHSQVDSQPLLKQTHFFKYAAGYPWRSHALWFLHQMQQWQQLDNDIDLKAIATQVYQPDIFREVATQLGIPHPTIDCKPEGFHNSEWILQGNAGAVTMGSDLFFNGATFDPNSC